MNTVVQSEEFAVWLKALKDPVARARIIVRVKRLAAGNMGDVKHFDGISKMRVDYGPGYRVYFAKQGSHLSIAQRWRQVHAETKYRKSQEAARA